MKAIALAVLLVIGCKDKHEPPRHDEHPAPVAIDAGIDDSVCDAAIHKAAKAAPEARAAALMACTVCGDWTPILDWNIMSTEGGPARADLDAALHRCNASCDTAAARKMASVLDTARGTENRSPWRMLGDSCKDKVSAVPDSRYMSAPFFVLDRIGRAIGGRGGDLAKLLATIDVPIPAVTISGVGPTLPEGIAQVHTAGPAAITLLGPEVRLGVLPHATLGPTGVTVAGNFPGELVSDLAAAVAKLGDAPIVILAPEQMPAAKVVAVVDASHRSEMGFDSQAPLQRPIELAVASPSTPRTWQVPAAIPVALNGGSMAEDVLRIALTNGKIDAFPSVGVTSIRIVVDTTSTVGDLAKLLGRLASQGTHQVEISVTKAKP